MIQFKITLLGPDPLIWRRICVPANMTLTKFQNVVKIVMGWQNTHLCYFELNGKSYRDHELELDDESAPQPFTTPLAEVLEQAKIFLYLYD